MTKGHVQHLQAAPFRVCFFVLPSLGTTILRLWNRTSPTLDHH